MVFPSIPAAYLDPPNWHLQQQGNQQNGSNHSHDRGSDQLLPSAPLPHLTVLHPHGGGEAGFIRPGSMTERARLANIAIPETPLPCPRCESTNTKFCYFNNYSLTQPRHFCKTCRRYWTLGGALRSVPVGGGCRRNKRTKGSGSSRSSSKSSSANTIDRHSTNSASSSTTLTASMNAADILGLGSGTPPLRLMAPLQNLTHFTDADSIGLNFGSVSDQVGGGGGGDLGFPIGSSLRTAAGSSMLYGLNQWRLTQQVPQFPFFAGLDSSGAPTTTTQLEESNQELNLSRQFLSMNNNNSDGNDHQQYWNVGAGVSAASLWTDLSTNFSSSSTGNIPL